MAKTGSARIYQFPLPLDDSPSDVPAVVGEILPAHSLTRSTPVADAVLSGTFRKDPEGLKYAYEELRDLGFRVLSPSNVNITSEIDGFVFMQGEQSQAPQEIEARHLNAIQDAQFVWLHAPDGYVGLSAALEVGFANACGVPVYSSSQVKDPVLRSLVEMVASPRHLRVKVIGNQLPLPHPAIRSFQKYYYRAAVQRGYHNESARDTLLLMVEEVGELARAIRKSEQLMRHGKKIDNDEGAELADVFIYVVHLANVLGLDLGAVVREKELINIEKIAGKKR